MLPHLPKESDIDPDEAIGIEHLVVGEKFHHLRLDLREESTEMIFEEQYQQKKLFGSCNPELLASVALQYSQLSSSIAQIFADRIAS